MLKMSLVDKTKREVEKGKMYGFLMSSFSTCHGSMRIDPSFSVTLNLKINFCVEGPLNIVLTVPMKNYVAKKIIVK